MRAVPWCETCDRFLSPSTVRTDGSCPTCGVSVEGGHARVRRRVPWHLTLLLAVFAVYLTYRLIQGGAWLVDQL